MIFPYKLFNNPPKSPCQNTPFLFKTWRKPGANKKLTIRIKFQVVGYQGWALGRISYF
jgi:hypothetical protein